MTETNDPSLEQAPGLQVHEADDGLIVFDPENDRVHHLNASAGVLFSLCDRPQTNKQLARLFLQAYELSEDNAPQVQQSIDQLISEGLLISPDH